LNFGMIIHPLICLIWNLFNKHFKWTSCYIVETCSFKSTFYFSLRQGDSYYDIGSMMSLRSWKHVLSRENILTQSYTSLEGRGSNVWYGQQNTPSV
jgi:hypothetical protein